jgi:hypothetical protein
LHHTFLLSPARCDGRRAQILLNPNASFDLALRLRADGPGAPIGEVFSFLSGLYFRGKLAYANAFGDGAHGVPPTLIITTDRGLVAPETVIRRDDLIAFSDVDIASKDDRYVSPLRRDTEALHSALGDDGIVVLLGSIATAKYTEILIDTFGERLLFPVAFVGRGDMSRGGLLLRHVQKGSELDYAPVVGADRRGKRPPKLGPK